MDSRDKSKLSDRLHEEALGQRMGEALDRLSPVDIGECPDAEIIAAYLEHALGPSENTQWDTHFARCARCRNILAVLAASVEEPLADDGSARLGEMAGSATRPVHAVPPQTIKPLRPSTWDWRARWLAPALGLAAVVAVWFAVRPPWRANNRESAGTLIAQAPKNDALPRTELQSVDRFSKLEPKKKEAEVAAPAANSARDESALKALRTTPAATPSDEDGAKNGNTISDLSPNAGPAQNALRDETQNRSELDVAPAAAPAPAPQAQARIAGRAREAAEAPASATQAVTVIGEAPPVSTAQNKAGDSVAPQRTSNEPVNGQPTKGGAYAALAKAAAEPGSGILVSTPSRTQLWQAGSKGSIQHSSDGGVTWTPQESPSPEDWLAGSAASEIVCWLVGRNGAIARTADGQRWEKIVPPSFSANGQGKFPDWTGVTARDAETATITAGDRRRYATRDGGKTWQAQ